MTISNRISLDELRLMAVGDIAALPAEQLALLQDEADEALRRAKTACDWLAGAVALKYADRAHAARQAAGRTPARSLRRRRGHRDRRSAQARRLGPGEARRAGGRYPSRGDDPAEYVDVSIKVPEQVRGLAEPHPLRPRTRAPFAPASPAPSFPEHRGDVMSITKKLAVLREQHYGLEKLPETIRVPAIADRRDETSSRSGRRRSTTWHSPSSD